MRKILKNTGFILMVASPIVLVVYLGYPLIERALSRIGYGGFYGIWSLGIILTLSILLITMVISAVWVLEGYFSNQSKQNSCNVEVNDRDENDL